MNETYLKKYADFVVRSGTALQKGETLIIRTDVESAPFVRQCAEAAFAAGAKDVVVHYADEQVNRTRLQHAGLAALEDVKPWRLASLMDYVEDGVCSLYVLSGDPEIFSGLDSEKVEKAQRANSRALMPWRDLTMTNKVRWSIAAVPGEAWARKVFPGLPTEEAVQKLWDAILLTARVEEDGDPVAVWEKHVASLHGHAAWLQSLDLDALHLTASNGTDLMVGLADDHVWEGGGDNGADGVHFLANIPTEEVFTAPHCRRTNGVVKTSLPYVYNGSLITGITVRFEEGKVVEYSAESGADLLEQMMSADEGAKRIGEVALVPASSPVRKTGILFYNTLFDENAACHIAFGDGYPGTVAGGNDMTREELDAKGVNDSLIHEDVMIGTADMNITGITKTGEKVQIFVNGEWAR